MYNQDEEKESKNLGQILDEVREYLTSEYGFNRMRLVYIKDRTMPFLIFRFERNLIGVELSETFVEEPIRKDSIQREIATGEIIDGFKLFDHAIDGLCLVEIHEVVAE